MIPAPPLRHIGTLDVEVSDTTTLAETAFGTRRIVPITGGTVRFGETTGRVLPGGADFQLVSADLTAAHLEAKYAVELDDGTRLFVDNRAIRVASPEDAVALGRGEAVDPARVYFRCSPRLHADAGSAWGWVSNHVFVGTGERAAHGVHIEIFAVD